MQHPDYFVAKEYNASSGDVHTLCVCWISWQFPTNYLSRVRYLLTSLFKFIHYVLTGLYFPLMKLFPQPNKIFISVQRKVIIDLGFFISEMGSHFPIATPLKNTTVSCILKIYSNCCEPITSSMTVSWKSTANITVIGYMTNTDDE